MKEFISDLGVIPSASGQMKIFCENIGAIALAKESRFHKRTQHIKRRFNSIRHQVVEEWYVSNASIVYEVFMPLYYHSWMFYNYFIATLYHFLGLTYWRSAQCQLMFFACFLHRRESISNGVQTQWNFLWIFSAPEDTIWAKKVPKGCSEGSTTH